MEENKKEEESDGYEYKDLPPLVSLQTTRVLREKLPSRPDLPRWASSKVGTPISVHLRVFI